MDCLLPDNGIIPPVEMDSILPEFDYLTGGSLDSEVTDPLIYDAWGTVRDELTDFLLAVDFATDMQMAFGREVDVESGKEHIIDILNGESLPGIRVLPAANMYPAVGAFDMVTDTVYLADSLLDGSSGVDDGVLVDVLLEEVGHFLDGLLHEEDSLGDEGELFGRLVSGEELREWEVLEFLDEDDWVEILDGDVAVEVEASQEVDFEEVGRFDVGNGILAVGDFNRDGFADLAVPNGSNKVSVSLGKGDGSFRKATNFDIGAKSGLVEVEDFNADGFTDLVVVNSTSGNASVLLGKGNGSFRKSTNFNVGSSSSFNVGSSSRLVAVEDFNADGFADLAVVNSTSDTVSDTVSVLLGKGNGSFDPATNFVDVGDVSLLEGAAGYFNGDGFADLAVVNTISDTVSVLLGKGDGSFRKPTNFDVENYPWSVAVADFNRDGSADIAVANLLGGSVSVLLGKGNGSFRRPTNFDVGSGPNSLAEGDFNRDGFADLAVVINSSENISVLLGKGNGSFLPAINFDVEDSPSLVVVEDFNRDGLPDLAVTNGEDDNISILINKTPITTTPKITISDTKTTESNTNKTANFTVTLDNPSNETVKVNYTTANQTAKVNQDYQQTKGTLTFQPGETQQTIPVTILGDKRDENNEKFKLTLSRPQNAELQDNQAIATIVDNDAPPQISISDATVTEGNRGRKKMEFEVKLNNPSDKTVRVNYATTDGSAKSGQDYQRKNGVLTFKSGETEKKVSISVLGDTRDENNEKFDVKLSRARNAKLSDRKGVGTIRDNDEKVIIPEVSISDARVTEGNRGEKKMKFEVELSAASQKTVQVNYATKDGSAKSGEDYEKVNGVVRFKPGEKKKVVSVPVLGDNRNENNEQFQVSLSRVKNAKLSDRKGVGVIRDNDTEPVKPKEPVEPIFPDAINLGLLSQEQISRVDNIGLIEGVNNRDTEDVYRFRVRREGTVSIFVDNFVQDLGIKLYDEDETLINQSNVDGIGSEVIQTILERGVYYVEIFPVGSSATGYRLIANIV